MGQFLLIPFLIKKWLEKILEVGVHLLPLLNGRNDAEADDFFAHLLEMLVAGSESCHFLFGTFGSGEVNTGSVDNGGHSHHDVLHAALVAVDVAACGPGEGLATHSALDHLDGLVSGALE